MKQNKLHYEDMLQKSGKHSTQRSCIDPYYSSRPLGTIQSIQRWNKENSKIVVDLSQRSTKAVANHIRNNAEIYTKAWAKESRNFDSNPKDFTKSGSIRNCSYNSIYERHRKWSEMVKQKRENALREK